MNQHHPDKKEDAAKHEILKRPGKDDVHEQRERDQERPGTIHQPAQTPVEKKPRP